MISVSDECNVCVCVCVGGGVTPICPLVITVTAVKVYPTVKMDYQWLVNGQGTIKLLTGV